MEEQRDQEIINQEYLAARSSQKDTREKHKNQAVSAKKLDDAAQQERIYREQRENMTSVSGKLTSQQVQSTAESSAANATEWQQMARKKKQQRMESIHSKASSASFKTVQEYQPVRSDCFFLQLIAKPTFVLHPHRPPVHPTSCGP